MVTTIEELDLDGAAASSNSNLLMLDSMSNPLKACEVQPYGAAGQSVCFGVKNLESVIIIFSMFCFLSI